VVVAGSTACRFLGRLSRSVAAERLLTPYFSSVSKLGARQAQEAGGRLGLSATIPRSTLSRFSIGGKRCARFR